MKLLQKNLVKSYLVSLKQMDRKYLIVGLSLLFFLAFILRVLYLPRLALTFGYDQARDALVTQQILGGDLKILGPPASTPGLYHGIFYNYLLAPAYLFGKGNPIAAAYWIALLNALTVLLVYFLTYLLIRRVGVSLLASFLFAISFQATQYAVWLSDPTIGIWTVPVFYLGLWLWLKEAKRWGAILAGVGLGLTIQADISLAYHLVPLGFWLWVERRRIQRKSLFMFIAAFTLSVLTMILVEFKFNFKAIGGISYLLSSQDAHTKTKDIGDFIVLYLNQYGKTFTNSVLPSNPGFGGALGVIGLFWLMKSWYEEHRRKILSWQIFLATYLLAHLPIVSLGGFGTPFLTVGLGVASVILTSLILAAIWKKNRYLAILLTLAIIISNISSITSQNKDGQTLFAIQKDMLLSKQLQAVDYTYRESKSEPFSINTFTSPLWVNTVWSYLYNWYGKAKFGYLPQWHGRDQIGQLGNNLAATSPSTKLYFFIIEPPQGIPEQYLPLEIGSEDAKSTLLEEKNFGEIRVQKRIKK